MWTIIQTLLCTLLAVRNSPLLQVLLLQMLILQPFTEDVSHTNEDLLSYITQKNSLLALHYRLYLTWYESCYSPYYLNFKNIKMSATIF